VGRGIIKEDQAGVFERGPVVLVDGGSAAQAHSLDRFPQQDR